MILQMTSGCTNRYISLQIAMSFSPNRHRILIFFHWKKSKTFAAVIKWERTRQDPSLAAPVLRARMPVWQVSWRRLEMAWGKVGPKWWARMEVKWKTQMLNHGIFESGLAKLFREFSSPHFPIFFT